MHHKLQSYARHSGSLSLVLVLLALTAQLPQGLASILNCTYDAAGRLVGAQYDSVTNLTYHYDHNGSIREVTGFSTTGPDLAVTQSSIPSTPTIGVPFQLHISVVNLAAVRATAVRLSADFPATYTILSAVASVGACSITGTKLTCDIGNLDAGKDVAVQVTIRPSIPGPSLHTIVISTDADANSANNTSTQTATILHPPALTLQPSLSASTGMEITWPAVNEGLILEETTDLSPPTFWDRTLEPSLFGDTFRFQIISEAGNRFYRLRSLP